MRVQFVIPVLASILILGSLGLTQDAFAVTPVTSCGTLSVAGETYELSNDITTSGTCFVISANNIIFDGMGHTLTGDGTGDGIQINSVTGVTIKNVNVESFLRGILLAGVERVTVSDNIVSSNGGFGIQVFFSTDYNISGNTANSNGLVGISIVNSNNITVDGNTGNSNGSVGLSVIDSVDSIINNNQFNDNANEGIFLLTSSNGNTISDNTANSNTRGIRIQGSDANVLMGNTISGNSVNGMFIHDDVNTGTSDNNQVYNNNFINNPTQASVPGTGVGNVFNLPIPTGGNFWDNFDESAEGCDDVNNDNFCDSPFLFVGGQDNLPWTIQDGWLGKNNPCDALDHAESSGQGNKKGIPIAKENNNCN